MSRRSAQVISMCWVSLFMGAVALIKPISGICMRIVTPLLVLAYVFSFPLCSGAQTYNAPTSLNAIPYPGTFPCPSSSPCPTVATISTIATTGRVATVTCTAACGIVQDNTVTIAGTSVSGLNGTFYVTSGSGKTFTFSTSTTGPSTGGNVLAGQPVGAGFCFTPSEFSAVTMCRVTDVLTYSHGTNSSWSSSDSGSAEVNLFDHSRTRFAIGSGNGWQHFFQLTANGVHTTFSELYGSNFIQSGSSMWADFNTDYIFYQVHTNDSNDIAIFSYDTSSIVTAPKPMQLKDLTTAGCATELSGIGTGYIDDISVSRDGQTFAVLAGSTSNQDSAGVVYAIIWNRASGCRVYNTSTGAVTGQWGPTGRISCAQCVSTPVFTMHNMRLSLDGNWVKITPSFVPTTIGGVANVGNPVFWNVPSLTLTLQTSGNRPSDPTGCGHYAIGYAHSANKCDTGPPHLQMYIRTNLQPNNNATILTQNLPSSSCGQDAHISWNNDNVNDNAPFLMTFTGCTPWQSKNAWDSIVAAVATDGSGNVWQLAHTYGTYLNASFPAQQSVGAPSADGSLYLLSTDWAGLLGNDTGGGLCLTQSVATSTCRADVFLLILPIGVSNSPLPPPSLRIIGIQ